MNNISTREEKGKAKKKRGTKGEGEKKNSRSGVTRRDEGFFNRWRDEEAIVDWSFILISTSTGPEGEVV